MNCINFRTRTKKYEKYFYCTKLKKNISYEDCKNCSCKEYKKMKTIAKRSKKLAKLERDRDKNITKSGICDACHKFCNHLDSHEVYGGSNRKRSIENGFVKEICRECHSNEDKINELRIDTQIEYEKEHTREEFIQIIGKSYV